MGIAFDAPLALLLLLPALGLTIALYLGARRRVGASRRRLALIVRVALLTSLVLALAGFRLVLPVDRLATVFVVDRSDSVGDRLAGGFQRMRCTMPRSGADRETKPSPPKAMLPAASDVPSATNSPLPRLTSNKISADELSSSARPK